MESGVKMACKRRAELGIGRLPDHAQPGGSYLRLTQLKVVWSKSVQSNLYQQNRIQRNTTQANQIDPIRLSAV